MMAALHGRQPDRVPIWELIINRPVIEALYGNISYADFVQLEDLDGITASEDQETKKLSSDTYRDEWGITWKIEPSGLSYPVKGPIKSRRDLHEYEPPDPDAPGRLETLDRYINRFGKEKAVIFLGHETFEFSHYLISGMDRLFVNYFSNPDFAKELADMVGAYKCRVLRNAAKAGADAILTGDDYAGRSGPFVSMRHFKEFILPYLKKAVGIAKDEGVPFIKHADGNLWRILDMIVETGIDALDPIEPIANMDIGEVKRLYGDRICVIGNVDCTIILTMSSEHEVAEAVKETIAKASPGGGHILASSNSIHPAVRPENYKAMVNTAKEYGVYPLDQDFVKKYAKKEYARHILLPDKRSHIIPIEERDRERAKTYENK
jgi:uroporphyrinogen decarboxylase